MLRFPKFRGISRMKYEKTSPGWFARYTREGVTFAKHFADKDFDSADASLQAAKAWHQRARELLPPMSRREYSNQRKSNNKSGIVGVYRTTSVTKGHRYAFWVASWSPWKKKKGMQSFAVGRYGEEGAKQMAIAARDEAIKQLQDEWPDDYWEYRRRLDGTASPSTRQSGTLDIYAFEGVQTHRTHLARERDRDLRSAKIDSFLEVHGKLFCEICGFDFELVYGEIGRDIIEIHHTFPVSEMEENHKTHLNDLLCVCANCHLVLHNGDPYVNLQKLKFIFDAKKKIKRTDQSTESRAFGTSGISPAEQARMPEASGMR